MQWCSTPSKMSCITSCTKPPLNVEKRGISRRAGIPLLLDSLELNVAFWRASLGQEEVGEWEGTQTQKDPVCHSVKKISYM